MSFREIKTKAQDDFKSGLSRSEIFVKYAEKGVSDERLATIVATLRDSDLIKKYKLLNYILVVFLVLIFIVIAFSAYEVILNSTTNAALLMLLVAALPLVFLYGIIRGYHQAYFLYVIMITLRLPSHIDGFGSDLFFNIIDLCLALFIACLTWYLKFKLFPFMGVFGPKIDSTGNYAFKQHS